MIVYKRDPPTSGLKKPRSGRGTLDGDRGAHRFSIATALKNLNYLESMADSTGLKIPSGTLPRTHLREQFAGVRPINVPMLTMHVGRINGVDLKPSQNT